MEWSGIEWNGLEWNRMEWNGMEWNTIESTVFVAVATLYSTLENISHFLTPKQFVHSIADAQTYHTIVIEILGLTVTGFV